MMLTRIRELLAPPVFEGDEERTRLSRLLNGILWSLLALSAITAPPLIAFGQTASIRVVSAATVGVVVLTSLGLLWLMRRGRPRLASALFLSFLLANLAANTLYFGGIRNTATAGYLLVIVMGGLLLERRGTLAFSLATLLVILGLFWAERTYGGLPILSLAPQASVGDLIIFLSVSILMTVLMGFALHDLTEALRRARHGEEELVASNRELRASRDALQATMLDLERRNEQVRLASEVARDAAAAQGLDEILERAVELMQTRFNLYHAGLFLVDEQQEYAVLRAAAGYGVEQALERGFRLRVGEEGTVGRVTTSGRPYMVQDVREDPIYIDHPLSREVRSEVMLPLRAGGGKRPGEGGRNRRGDIIGAIGFQRQEVGGFDEDEVAVLQIMADQLAVAIENTRLIDELEQTVREMELASGHYTRESWRAMSRGSEHIPGYRYRRLGVEPAHEYPSEASTKAAWREGRSVVKARSDEGGEGPGAGESQGKAVGTTALQGGGTAEGDVNAAAVPIKLREQVIGVFKLSSKEGDISPEALSLVEEAADRLALALENARLLEETRRRAAREQLTREITDKMHRAPGVERIVRTAVDELYDALGTSRAFVQLGSPSMKGSEAAPSSSQDDGSTGEVAWALGKSDGK